MTSVKTITDFIQPQRGIMSEHGVKSISDFAAEIGVHRQVIGVVVANYELPIEPMQHGVAKGLSLKTQRVVKRILKIKPGRTPVTAA